MVEIYCKGCEEEPILIYEDGSYIGEISLMCKIKNQMKYSLKPCEHTSNKTKLYRIIKRDFEDIMSAFPDFERVLLTRAVRKQRYIRKLRREKKEYVKIRRSRAAMKDLDTFVQSIIEVKRARLVEHNLSYEQLMCCDDLFSDDEITMTNSYMKMKQIKTIKAIKNTIKFSEHLRDVQRIALKTCKEIVNTISKIDKGNRQMNLRKFIPMEVNSLDECAEDILYDIH